MRTHLRLLTLPILAALSTCECEPPPPPPEDEDGVEEDELDFELFDSTYLLEPSTLETIERLDADGTLRFTGSPESLQDLERFDVILGGPTDATPRGLMRLVTEVEETASGLVVRTLPAPLQMAFRRLHVRATRSTPADGESVHVGRAGQLQQSLSFTQDGWKEWTVDEPLYDVDGDPSSTYDQVYGQGLLAGGITYTFSIDADWDDVADTIEDVKDCLEGLLSLSFECSPQELLPEVRTVMEIVAGASAELDLAGVAFLEYTSSFPAYQDPLEPIPIGPLWFFPHLEVIAEFEGAASSQFAMSWSAHATVESSLGYSTKTGASIPLPDFDAGFEPGPVDAVLQAHSAFRIGPQVSILLYDVMGPTAALLIGAELRADQDQSPCWHLVGKVDGSVGIFIGLKELPGFELIDEKVEFNVAEQEFASGACGTPPPVLPPQAGDPGPAALQDPQFAPWAFAYPGTVNSHPFEGPGAQLEWSQLTPTIDGRFWLTGSEVRVLTSLEPDGRVAWAKRYVADVDYWTDTQIPDLLITRAAPTEDAAMMLLAHPYTLLKVDPAGELFWARRLALDVYRETWLRFTDLAPDGAGGFYVAGTVGDEYNSSLHHDALVVRIDAEGELLWTRRLGDTTWGENPRALVALEDGVVAIGAMWDDSGARWRGLAFRLDDQGGLVWARQLVIDDCGGGNEQRIQPTTALRSRDGDINVGAAIERSGYEAAVFKLKPDGDLPWYASFRTATFNHLGPITTGLIQLPSTGFLATGNYSGAAGEDDWWVAGLDAAGAVQWARTYGGHQNPVNPLYVDDSYPSIQITQDGGALIAGYTVSLASDDATWALKAPARSGELTLSSALNASVEELSTTPGETCLSGVAWPLPVVDDDVAALEALTVFVEQVSVPGRDLL